MNGRAASLTLGALIVVFPLCFMWQGLDVTDTGYYAVNCQQFFNAYPSDFGDAQTTAYWLTNCLGACWYKLTGECGVIGFRCLYVLLTYGTLALTFWALRGYQRSLVLLGLLAAEVLCVGQDIDVPAYNQVTSLFFAGSAAALYCGLVRRSNLLVLVGGMAAGMSIFARIVNIPIIVLAAGVWYYHYLRQAGGPGSIIGSVKSSVREITTFALGVGCGVGIIVVIIGGVGHLGAFRAMWTGLFDIAAGPKAGYGPVVLLKKFAWDYINTGLLALGFLALAWLVGVQAARVQRPRARGLLILVCAGVATFLLLRFPLLNTWAMSAVLNVILLGAVLGVLDCGVDLRLLSFLAAVVLFVTPLGSADGMCNSFHGMFLAVPAALLVLMTGSKKNEAEATTPGARGQGRLGGLEDYLDTRLDRPAVGWLCVIFVLGFGALYRMQFTYRDSSHRLAMRSVVHHPKLWGVFTTASRARALQELLEQLGPLVRNGDYLFDHMQLPLIYFLTQTKPYLYTSWPNLYQPAQFRAAFKRAESARASLPVCVITKVDTCHPGWPEETYPPFQTYRFVENHRTVEAFLQDHRYRQVWENNAFEIWTAAERKSAGARAF